jgi:c-di-GMP-binding flagellar brake protein YcgR
MDAKIALGELFEIRIGDTTVRTKLLEIVSDTECIILQPTLKGVPVRAENEAVPFTFYKADGCYSFRAKMLSPFRKGGLLLCKVMRVSEIKRIQRRQYYRLPIVLNAAIYEQAEDGAEKVYRCKAKTADLSEQSVALTCFSRFEPDTSLTVEIKLSSAETVAARAKVLRCVKPLIETDPYRIVLIFTEPQENAKTLRRFIFTQQVLHRKKSSKDLDS